MSRPVTTVENNFTRGLITEATGLNFPENAATDASNCEFTLIGDVTRRLGINKEPDHFDYSVSQLTQFAVSSYVWNNPGGFSNSKILVRQAEGYLFFYDITHVTSAAPGISQGQLVNQSFNVGNFAADGVTFSSSKECTFADGNGYLFVYHEDCVPFYCTFDGNNIFSNPISLQIRDFTGALDTLPVNTRPTSLSDVHRYNLYNQGWTQGPPWFGVSSSNYTLGTLTSSVGFTIQAGLTIAGGTNVVVVYTGAQAFTAGGILKPGTPVAGGTVVSYTSGSGAIVLNLTLEYTSCTGTFSSWDIAPSSTGNINTFFSAASAYPSNADVWWYFKDSTGVFNPSSTLNNVSFSTGNAPQGHFLLDPFNQNRSAASALTSISNVSTGKRPTVGAWWQGRVWYAGVNDSAAATSTTSFYSWTGNIYYSTTVTSPVDFGVCYQTNDPTSENLNGELPTDGGVVVIPESGTVYKLFPIQNGLLVFANNGIWFITGSQGIGFASNDYTVTKISSIRSFSWTSFVDVNGLPFFWNEEGIYQVMPSQNGSLTVEPITVGTILTFYNNIPLSSKIYARGSYDPVDYRIQWVYRSTAEQNGVTDRYLFDTILNYNTYNKAFYPYTVLPGSDKTYISGINYITYPTPVNSPIVSPGFKYLCFSQVASTFTIAQEYDTTYVDWGSVNYVSTFTTGYKVHGSGLYKFGIPYITVFNRTDEDYLAYYIQGIWDYAITSDSNRWSTQQFVEILDSNYNMVARRHKIRGRGLTLQIRFTSVDGQPFDIMGWAVYEAVNTGV